MSASDANTPLVRILAVLAAMLALVLLVELAWFALAGGAREAGGQSWSPDVGELADGPGGAGSRSAYDEVHNRPLFNSSRRRIVHRAPPVERKKEDPLQSKWSLSAVIETGSDIYAIFAQISGGSKRLRLHQGERLDGWSVDAISSGKVVLKRGREEEVFILGAAPPDAKKTGKNAPRGSNSAANKADDGPRRGQKGPQSAEKGPQRSDNSPQRSDNSPQGSDSGPQGTQSKPEQAENASQTPEN